MESVSLENKLQSQKVDRVVLDIESISAVQKIADQIQMMLGDLVQPSQKDIINFLLQERSCELTAAEIEIIKNKHFDIVRALKRATQEAIKAKQDGAEIQIDELLKIIQTPSVNKTRTFKKPRGRKKKENGASEVPTENKISVVDPGPSELAIIQTQKKQHLDSKSEKMQTLSKPILA